MDFTKNSKCSRPQARTNVSAFFVQQARRCATMEDTKRIRAKFLKYVVCVRVCVVDA